jgi:hypothetical protein
MFNSRLGPVGNSLVIHLLLFAPEGSQPGVSP